MKRDFLLGAAISGFLVLAAAGWTQDPEPVAPVVKAKAEPPTFRDVLKGYVGRTCTVWQGQATYFLQFPEDKKKGNRAANELWERFAHRATPVTSSTVTLRAVGSDFVQFLWTDGTERYISIERVELEVGK